MTQAKRTVGRWHGVALAGCALAAVGLCAVTVAVVGCSQGHFVSPENRPGTAQCVYWAWTDLNVSDVLTPAAPPARRWNEFVNAGRQHNVLIHDFLYLEGHPEAVDPTWRQNMVPEVTGEAYLNYRSAGRWHVVHRHFAPNALSLYYLRVPAGRLIDNADAERWRFPVGTELVQLLYHRGGHASGHEPTAQLVEWRRMRMAGDGCGQMRSDGTRSDWVFESAIRDPDDGLWRRTRDDDRDVTWVKLGALGKRFQWPVVRPHTCAECHRLAGRSPLDGPRGGGEVYTLGDLRDVVWAGQLAELMPMLKYPKGAAINQGPIRQARPPDPDERYRLYVRLLAEQRQQLLALVKAQQKMLDTSPFQPDDATAQAAGRQVYLTQCGVCHGAEARGGGPLALRRPAAPPLVGLGPSRWLKTLRAGRGTMPAWNAVLPADEQWRLIEHLKTLR